MDRFVGRQARLASLFGNLVNVVYMVGFWAWRGQTPGMTVVGIRVVTPDGSRLSVGRAFVRYVGSIVSSVVVFVGYFMIVWDRRKQALHDKIADTYVVRT